MTNLPATFKIDHTIGSAYALPVLVDLQALGCLMTLPNGGVIPSRASLTPSRPSNDGSDSDLCI